jgi:hypothetical protein
MGRVLSLSEYTGTYFKQFVATFSYIKTYIEKASLSAITSYIKDTWILGSCPTTFKKSCVKPAVLSCSASRGPHKDTTQKWSSKASVELKTFYSNNATWLFII